MILGREGRHLWTPYGASEPQARLNEKLDDAGNRVSPVIRLKRAGLASLGDAEDNRDMRVGTDGEIPRASRRRGKTITYEGTIRADSLRELREYQSDLRQAFADRSNEGRMDVEPHPLSTVFDVDTDSRYFNARVISLDMDDITDSQRWESTFVLGLRMSDPRYFQDLTLAAFKQAIVDLEPALYWALDGTDEATDLSGNGNDGTAEAGLVFGGGASLTALAGDESTDFDGATGGTGDYISSTYAPQAVAGKRTYLGVGNLDTLAGPPRRPLFVLGNASVFGIESGNTFRAVISGSVSIVFTWPGITPPAEDTTFSWALKVDPQATSDAVELFIDGESQGFGTPSPSATAIGTSSDVFQAGSSGMGSLPIPAWNGLQSHMAVFERALTAQEIADFSEQAATALRAYW